MLISQRQTQGTFKTKQGNVMWLCYEITTKFFIHFFIQNLRKFFSRKEKVAHFFAMRKNYIRTCFGNQEIKQCIITISCAYRNSSISKTELFVRKVNDWKPLTIVRNCPFLNVGGFLELSLGHTNLPILSTFLYVKYDYIFAVHLLLIHLLIFSI